MDELTQLLTPSTLDGTECYVVIENLATSIAAAGDDALRIRAAMADAKKRLHALTAGTVPREAVDNAVCLLWEK
jgi:hypothetical protein